MLKKNKWTVVADGIEHIIEFKKGFRCRVIVDGEEEILKSKNLFIMIIDKVINLGSKSANLVVLGGRIDLAVDGVFLNSKKEYVPVSSLPKWTWFFATICALPVIVFRGGAINAALAVTGVSLCLANSAEQNRSKFARIVINVIITTFVWALDLFMIGLVSYIRYY